MSAGIASPGLPEGSSHGAEPEMSLRRAAVEVIDHIEYGYEETKELVGVKAGAVSSGSGPGGNQPAGLERGTRACAPA